MADPKKPIDWTEIERDYRTGTMSIREMARWYGVSDKAIRNRAKAEGWDRENAAASPQRGHADPEPQKVYVGTVLTPENATPEAIVGRGRNLVLRLLDELDASTSRLGELDAMIVAATDSGDAQQQREALRQAVSLKQRSDVLKALATATKTFGESQGAQGKKAARQAAGERVASGGGKYATPSAPRLIVHNR